MLSLQDLATLVEVADAGSIRAAASSLGRTQPALTQAIRRLEDAVGVELIDRSAYRARLTAQGQVFVDRARPLLKQARSLRDFGELLSRGVEPRLRVAIDSATPGAAWTGLLRDVTARFPDTIIEVEAGEGSMPLRRLAGGEADLAIAFDMVVDHAGSSLERLSLGEAAFTALVRGDQSAQPEDGQQPPPQILVADFERSDPDIGRIEAQNYWRVGSHPLQLAAIRAGLGWGFVPDELIGQSPEDAALAPVAQGGLLARSRQGFSICRKRGLALGPVGAAIWEAAAERGPV